MRAEDIKPDSFSRALRNLRLSAGLTQQALADRTSALPAPFRTLLSSQISDFERGRALPAFMTLASMLTACSSSGTTLDFSMLQDALCEVEIVPEVDPLRGVATDLRSEVVRLRSKMTEHCAKGAAMLLRLTAIERALESRNGDGDRSPIDCLWDEMAF